VNTSISEEHSASIFRVKMIEVRIWPGHIGRMPRNVVIQSCGMGKGGRAMPRLMERVL
jgi:hypothetical protein